MTDIKWEAVEYGDLKPGDRVRLTHDNGDVIHGQVEYHLGAFGVRIVARWEPTALLSDSGYRFERAVPERTLPTEPAFYSVSKRPSGHERLLRLTDTGGWEQMFPRNHTPDNLHTDRWIAEVAHRGDRLTRLVPAPEVEEAEKRGRLVAIREVESHYPSGNPYIRKTWPEAFDSPLADA